MARKRGNPAIDDHKYIPGQRVSQSGQPQENAIDRCDFAKGAGFISIFLS